MLEVSLLKSVLYFTWGPSTSLVDMSGLKAGDQFPEDVVFSQAPPRSTLIGRCLQLHLIRYVPYTEEKSDITACGIPQNYNASKEWADKKVVLFAVPGQYITTFSGGTFLTAVQELLPRVVLQSTSRLTLKI